MYASHSYDFSNLFNRYLRLIKARINVENSIMLQSFKLIS